MTFTKIYCTSTNASFFNVHSGIVSLFLDESKKGNKELKDLLVDVKELSFLIVNRNCKKNHECKIFNELSEKLDSINYYDVAQIKTIARGL